MKKDTVIPTDEGQSFAELLAQFDGKTVELKSAMHGRVTSKPWSIVNENDKTRANAKSAFRNLLQQSSPVSPTNAMPGDINVSVVDAMRVVKMISIKKVSPRTFRGWGNEFCGYLKRLPGDIIHIVFDNYR